MQLARGVSKVGQNGHELNIVMHHVFGRVCSRGVETFLSHQKVCRKFWVNGRIGVAAQEVIQTESHSHASDKVAYLYGAQSIK